MQLSTYLCKRIERSARPPIEINGYGKRLIGCLLGAKQDRVCSLCRVRMQPTTATASSTALGCHLARINHRLA
jgi:hypothetical protein